MLAKKFFSIKFIYRALTLVVFVFWGVFAFSFVFNCISRVHLYPVKYKEHVYQYADYYGLDPFMIFSIIKIESGFKENTTSNKGAIGLMQITESTGKYIAQMQNVENYNLEDPKTNINFGCYYIKYLVMKFNDTNTALCAYNAGEGNVNMWLKISEYSKDGKTLYNTPFNETNEYIKKFHKTFENYKKLYQNILDKNKNFE